MLEEKKRYIIDFEDIPGDRAQMPEVPAGERVGTYEEIEKGFSPEQAQREAQRCLSCRRCLGCKLCLAACEKDAIVFDQVDETSEIDVDSIIITPGRIELSAGESLQCKADGIYSDDTIHNITNQVIWSSSDAAGRPT